MSFNDDVSSSNSSEKDQREQDAAKLAKASADPAAGLAAKPGAMDATVFAIPAFFAFRNEARALFEHAPTSALAGSESTPSADRSERHPPVGAATGGTSGEADAHASAQIGFPPASTSQSGLSPAATAAGPEATADAGLPAASGARGSGMSPEAASPGAEGVLSQASGHRPGAAPTTSAGQTSPAPPAASPVSEAEAPPHINQAPDVLDLEQGGEVAENAAPGSVVGRIEAHDPDAGDTLTFSLVDDAEGRFVIDSATGEIRVADGSRVDAETATSHEIVVRITDEGGLVLDRTVTLHVTDQNEFTVSQPRDLDGATAVIAENAAAGARVGITAAAADADATTNHVTYSLLADANGVFAIDSETGVVTIADPSTLDFESATALHINVEARSQDGSVSTRGYDIAIEDVAERQVLTAGNDAFTDTGVAELSIDGGAGNDVITGSATGANLLLGGAGDDVLIGGTQADMLDGGDGIDTVSYEASSAGVTVDLSVLTAQTSGGDASGDVLSGIENLVGTRFDDSLTGDAFANALDGGAGNDVLSGGDGDDTLTGGAGADMLIGGTGSDTHDGGAGVDTVVFTGARAEYHVSWDSDNSSYVITDSIAGRDGVDTVANVESFQFSDGVYTPDMFINAPKLETFEDSSLSGWTGAALVQGGANFSNFMTSAASYNNPTIYSSVLGIQGVQDVYKTFALSGTEQSVTVSFTFDMIDSWDGENFRVFVNDALFIDDNYIWTSPSIYTNNINDNVLANLGFGRWSEGFYTYSFTIDTNATSFKLGFGSNLDQFRNDEAWGIDNLVIRENAPNSAITYSRGSATADTLMGTASEDTLAGGTGDDILFGGDGNDILSGGAGNDILEGGLGNNILIGGMGLDAASYANATSAVIVNLAITAAQNTTGAGTDTFANIENIIGSIYDDMLTGDANANELEGGLGNNILDGGAGSDAASYSHAASAVTVDLAITTNQDTLGAGIDTFINIENLTGSAYDDTLIGDDNANVLNGGLGDDVLDGKAGLDTASYRDATSAVTVNLALAGAQNTGGAGFDTLINIENVIGSAYDDTLAGDAGANVIDGGAGTDTLTYAGASAGVTVSLAVTTAQNTIGAGTDTISGVENLIGSAYDDTLTGSSVANVIDGGAGDDTLQGGAGADMLIGGAGSDTASYAASTTAVTVNLARTTAQVSTGDASGDILSGIENLTGSASSDTLIGDAGANIINGGTGNDLLIGNANGAWQSSNSSKLTADLGPGALLSGPDQAFTLSYKFSSSDPTFIPDPASNTSFVSVLGADSASSFQMGLRTATSFRVWHGSEFCSEWALPTPLTDGAFHTLTATVSGLEVTAYVDGTKLGTANLSTALTQSAVSTLMINTQQGGGGNTSAQALFDDVAIYNRALSDAEVASLAQTGAASVTDGQIARYDFNGSTPLADSLGLKPTLTAVNDTGLVRYGQPGDAGDTLIGGDNNDTLIGGLGDDTLQGGNNNDILRGDAGNDTLDGGTGSDTADYSDLTSASGLNVTLNGAIAAAATITGLRNEIDSLVNIENVTGGAGNDVITGDANGNALTGGLGDDTLSAGAGNDTVTGGLGNDTIDGGAGNDVIDGGAGTDTLSYASATAGVTINLTVTTAQNTVGAGTDTITNIENLIGSAYSDTLRGGWGASVLDGGAGDDTLISLLGSDTLIGGAGVDTANYGTYSSGVTVDLSLTTAQIGTGDILSGIENLTGSNYDDVLTGDANSNVLSGGAGNDTLQGGGGNDTLIGGAGADTLIGGAGVDTASYAASSAAVTVDLTLATAQVSTGDASGDILSGIENLTGSNYNDILTGDANDNVMSGGSGNDVIDGGAGNDVMDGGAGTDTLSYASATAGITLNLAVTTAQNTFGAGTDTVSNFENLTGSAFNDVLTGNSGANVIDGGAGDDTLQGGAGADTLIGGAGNDTASYAASTVAVTVNLNLATAQVSTGDASGDILSGIENLTGSNYNDILTGDVNNNTLIGNAGNDTLTGGLGNDAIDGGAGTDIAVFSGAWKDYTITLANGVYTLVHKNGGVDGTDTVTNVETFRFSSGDVAASALLNDAPVITSGTTATALESVSDTTTLYTVVATDADSTLGDTKSYAITNDPSGLFEVDANGLVSLKAGMSLNYETATSYAITVQVTDANGAAVTKAVTISVSDVAETLVLTSGDDVFTDTGVKETSIDGGAGNDTITGFAGGINTLLGGAGDDRLTGSTGVDTLTGGTGNDTLDGGAGADVAVFSGAWKDYTITLASGVYTLVHKNGGVDGTDTVTNVETFRFSSGDVAVSALLNDAPVITSGTTATALESVSDTTTLYTVVATDADSTFGDTKSYAITNDPSGLFEVDANGLVSLKAGTSLNYETATNHTITVQVTDANGATATQTVTLSVSDVAETLVLTAGNDVFTDTGVAELSVNGGLGNDTITGTTGNDLISGGMGADTLDGGAGTDTADYSYLTSAQSLTLTLNGATSATATVTGGTAETDTLVNIENVTGGAGNDTITGDVNANVLNGGAGNDTLKGGSGADTLDGGAGTDTADYSYLTSAQSLTLTLNGATNATATVTGGTAETDTVVNIENVTGGAGNDTITGDANDNVIEGGAGNDALDGGAGIDTVSYASATAAVTVSLAITAAQNTIGAGTDTISNFENLIGSAYNDTLTGDANANVLTGGDGQDNLIGGAGNDTLSGGYGLDFLDGGLGNDTLDGGNSGDTFVFNWSKTSGQGWGQDTITDFNVGADKIKITGLGVDITSQAQFDELVTITPLTGTSFAISLKGAAALGDTQTIQIQKTSWYSGTGVVTPLSYSDFQFTKDPSVTWITGATGDDSLAGTSGNDTILGLAGNDTLNGGAGNDTLDGGSGADTASYFDATSAISVSLAATTAQNTYGAGTDTLTNIENLVGSAYADSLIGNAGGNTIQGGAGDDVLIGDQNFISNGDFAGSGVPTGMNWVTNGSLPSWSDPAAGSIQLLYDLSTDAHVGSGFEVELDNGSAVDNLKQSNIATVAGETYTLTIEAGYRNSPDEQMLVYWNGTQISTTTLTNAGLTAYSFTVTGTGNDTLTIAEPAAQNDSIGAIISGVRLLSNTTGGNDVLDGGAGNDQIYGGAGNDILDGGLGNNIIDGGAGTDTVSYASATAGVGVVLAWGGSTNFGGARVDTFLNIENLTGSAFDDGLSGNYNANVIDGGAGNDTLVGFESGDTLIGGAGNDTVNYSYNTDGLGVAIDLNLTTAQVNGNNMSNGDILSGIENITGSNYADILIGDAGANVLNGGAVNDTLTGGAGNDTLDGGTGTDTADYSYLTSAQSLTVILNGATNATATVTGGTAETDTIFNIENISGGAGNDTITGDANNNILTGGAGNDMLYGMIGSDTLYGGAGNDYLEGGGNKDYLYGGSGDDIYFVGSTEDDVFENANEGIDTLRTAGSGSFTLKDNFENFEYQSSGDVSLQGNAQNNVIQAIVINGTLRGGGADTINAGAGDDIIFTAAGNDIINGGLGNDTLDGGTGTDTADYSYLTSAQSLTLTLNGATNATATVTGGTAESDIVVNVENVTGGAGNDTITGDANDNVISGGAGDDLLSGGAGNDTFVFDFGGGHDTIIGGAGGGWIDTIELHGIDLSANGFGALTLTGGATVTSQNAHEIMLSPDAIGTITYASGETIAFSGVEHITW